MQIDISMQDQKHYGIRCVELVKSFLKEYEVLEPLILALKNILKYANLNDPYTVFILIYQGRT
jgi:non-canonical poly(A) RNA polymerase PAPD5/7